MRTVGEGGTGYRPDDSGGITSELAEFQKIVAVVASPLPYRSVTDIWLVFRYLHTLHHLRTYNVLDTFPSDRNDRHNDSEAIRNGCFDYI